MLLIFTAQQPLWKIINAYLNLKKSRVFVTFFFFLHEVELILVTTVKYRVCVDLKVYIKEHLNNSIIYATILFRIIKKIHKKYKYKLQ